MYKYFLKNDRKKVKKMKLKSVHELTLQEKIGQLILAGFHSTTVDEHLSTLIEEKSLGNVILFTRNFESADQMMHLTKEIHKKIIEKTGIIPFIAIDQEGGLVTRMMKDVTFAPGPGTTSASSYENATYLTGKMLARDMIHLGMNLNLAPSLDVNNNRDNPVINVRSLSDDPSVVANLGKEFIKGSLEYGVLPCEKHFPGHGDCAVDSHLGLPIINHDLERINQVELVPFISNIHTPCIMSAHILFDELDTVPATLSKKIMTGLLRDRLGFEGIIISDCLEMKAIEEHYGTAEGALQAILAGVDIVCISHTKHYQEEAISLITEAVKDGRLPLEELDKKVERILKYKAETISYLDKYFYNNDQFEKDYDALQIAQKIVDASFTKVEGTIPRIDVSTLIVAPVARARTIIEDEFDERNIAEALKREFPLSTIYELVETDEFKEMIMKQLSQFDHVLLFSYNAATSSFIVDFFNDILKEKDACVISLKGPMDYHKYLNLHHYYCLYEYTPNSIRTVIKALKNEITPTGHLPYKL